MPPKRDDETASLHLKIEKQDEALKEILWLLKGNKDLEIEGVIPAQKRIEIKINSMSEDVHALQSWRNNRGVMHLTWPDLARYFMYILGTIGTVAGIFVAYHEIFIKK